MNDSKIARIDRARIPLLVVRTLDQERIAAILRSMPTVAHATERNSQEDQTHSRWFLERL